MNKTIQMDALICSKPYTFEYIQTPIPTRTNDSSILKIKKVGICGTDIHAFEGTQPYFSYPRILGHEIAAEIHDTELGSGFSKGDKVTVIPYLHCGECVACRNGKTNCCVHMQVLGVHLDGGMCSFLNVPNKYIVKGNQLSLDELVLVEPLAIGAHGIRRANIVPGSYVLVVGAGPIGLGTMEMARIAGLKVIALDINQDRLDFCRNRIGVSAVINGRSDNVSKILQAITEGDMPLAIFDCTGNLQSINNAFQYASHGGSYILIGLQKGEIVFSHPEFHKRELTLMSSRNATMEDFEHVIECIEKKKINPENYITHCFDFEHIKDEFEVCLNPENRVVKGIINF